MVKNRRVGFDPWVGKMPWRRDGNLLRYSCLENPHEQRSLVGYSLEGRKELDTTERLNTVTTGQLQQLSTNTKA